MKKSIASVAGLLVVALGISFSYHADAAPKYLKKEDVNKAMVEYTKALGVKCNFCHTKDRSQNYQSLAGTNVSKEDLRALVHKRIARAMQAMMLSLNEREGKEYTCNTCHQGKADVEVQVK